MIQLFKVEIKKSLAKFSKHYVQYTFMLLCMIVMTCLGIAFRYNGLEIDNIERVMYLSLVYYLVVMRVVTQGISIPHGELVREDYDNKILKNASISKYSSKMHIIVRIFISSFINTISSMIVIGALITFLTGEFSLKNMLVVFIYYYIGLWFVYSLGIVYTCICKFFRLEKMVAAFFQLCIIVYLIISKPFAEISVFEQIKDEIYFAIQNELLFENIYTMDGKCVLFIVVDILMMACSLLLLDYTEYRTKMIRRKKYET